MPLDSFHVYLFPEFSVIPSKLENYTIPIESPETIIADAEPKDNTGLEKHKINPIYKSDQLKPKIDYRQQRLASRKQAKVARVAGFDFPLTCEEDVERLELMVNRNPIIRNQYVKYLATNKLSHVDVANILHQFFNDESLANFITSTPFVRENRKPMQKFAIFSACMLEAWSSQGVTQANLSSSLQKALQAVKLRLQID